MLAPLCGSHTADIPRHTIRFLRSKSDQSLGTLYVPASCNFGVTGQYARDRSHATNRNKPVGDFSSTVEQYSMEWASTRRQRRMSAIPTGPRKTLTFDGL